MEILDQELWDNTQEWLKNCKGANVHILHDYDADGISSGLLAFHALERLGANVSRSTRTGRGASLHKEHIEAVKRQHEPERIIILDQNPKSYKLYEHFRSVFSNEKILIIDHHFVEAPEDTLFIHPKLIFGIDGSDYCTSKFAFDIFSEATELSDLQWLAVPGIIGDMNARHFPDFIQEVAKEYDLTVPEDIFESDFAHITDTIDCCEAASEEDLLMYIDKLARCETLDEALAIPNPRQDVKDELNKYIDYVDEIGEIHGPITFLFIESRFSISGWVTTIVSTKYPHRIFIGYREQTDGFSVNARYQEAKVHMGKIMQEICESLGGGGGGHAPAAGGFVPHGKFDEFKKLLFEKVQSSLEDQS